MDDLMHAPDPRADIKAATNAFLMLVLLPGWIVPGIGDYLCHRRSHIERTSGTHESLTHSLMMATTGVGILCSLIFEVNEATLTVLAASAAVHEAIVLWDVGYAAGRREVTPTEQHLHSFLEVLPWTGLAFMACLNPDDVAALTGRGRPRAFRFVPKRDPVPAGYTAALVVLGTLALALPYAEELLRCYRTDRTFAPHPRPADPPR